MSYLSIPNWHRYQHYRDRTPIWVKLYVESMHDEKLRQLPLETRLVWHEMLKLAATFQNAVPNSPEAIGTLAGIPPEVCRESIHRLLKQRLLREKQTRRSASKSASVEVRRDKDKEENAPEPSAGKVKCPECELYPPRHVADCSKRLKVVNQ